MITGYNTDVEHGGVVYHVQTEDKGLESPIVMSLVYSGGAILAAKRASYADLIAAGFKEAALAERLKRQHRLICAAIKAGRIEELRQLSKPQTGRQVVEPPAPTVKADATLLDPLLPQLATVERKDAIPSDTVMEPPPSFDKADGVPASTQVGQPTEGETGPWVSTDSLMDASAAAPKTTGPSPYTVYDSRRRSRLGEVISQPDGLKITLLGHDPDFRGGENIQLKAIVTRIASDVEEPLGGAAISVKILGTTFRPVLLTLKTDSEGRMTVATRIPPFTSGRAAIVVRATASELSAEARWVVHPGR